MLEPNTNFVINSKMEAFVFKLSKEGEIIYDIFDAFLKSLGSNSLNEKKVKLYSVFIDAQDIIHLVTLINSGELNYYKYIGEKWSKNTIASFDLKSNIYNQIEILISGGSLHIIYNYSNLINSNIWTIQHVIYGTTNEERHNSVRYISKKNPDPFFVDIDSIGTIHLLYRTNLNSHSQIYHIFYSPYTKAWASVPRKISSDNINSLNPFIFIDSRDNLHGLLLEEINDGHKMKYFRMGSSGKEKYIWKEINLPYISISNYPPIIFEEDGKLKILYISDNSIEYLYSLDYGDSWTLSNTKDNFNENISMIKTPSNLSSNKHKIKYSYCSIFDSPILSSSNIYPNEINLPKELIEDIVKDQPEKNISPLMEMDGKIDQALDIYKTFELSLSMIISNQAIMENKLDSIQKQLEGNKQSFFSRLFKG